VADTVADQVYGRVRRLIERSPELTQAEAIRRVAADTGRSPAAASSAYYHGARRARAEQPPPAAPGPQEPRARGDRAVVAGSPALYSEMLPLVEAGATAAQAARRFGADEDAVAEIAAGFDRWRRRQEVAEPGAGGSPERLSELEMALRRAEARIASLEGQNRALRGDLARARQAMARAAQIIATEVD
jgi:hypothetical protein